ncbi:SUKH-4 family immunity protein [Streptomyces albogriseolus]|uniref:SUKH-4 family immunity protein n=1 Tax=Streptomyces albogriseolus TaxID=1887 RepID=UPI0036F4CBAB
MRFAVDEPGGLRGSFAVYAGDGGAGAVVRACRQLLAVFGPGVDGTPAPFWKMAALTRPLVLAADPGTASGLAVDLPPRLLDWEFGRGGVFRFEDTDFPSTLTHAPTRRFLSEVGVPDDLVFRLETDVMTLPTLAERCAQDWPGDDGGFPGVPCPDHAGHLVCLGRLADGSMVLVNGTTGAILRWRETGAAPRPLVPDISVLALALWLLRREAAPWSDRHGRVRAPDTAGVSREGDPWWPAVRSTAPVGVACAP